MSAIKEAELFADKYSLKILAATMITPKSALELSLKYDIPISACYRRIRILEEHNLVKKDDRFLNRRGKWETRYKSLVKNASIHFVDGKLKVELDLVTKKIPSKEEWDPLEMLIAEQ